MQHSPHAINLSLRINTICLLFFLHAISASLQILHTNHILLLSLFLLCFIVQSCIILPSAFLTRPHSVDLQTYPHTHSEETNTNRRTHRIQIISFRVLLDHRWFSLEFFLPTDQWKRSLSFSNDFKLIWRRKEIKRNIFYKYFNVTSIENKWKISNGQQKQH